MMDKIYDEYYFKIYYWALKKTNNKEDAEDIMQIVFAKIQELDKTKLPEDKEMTWLYTLTKNEALNYLKKKKEELSLDTIYEIENKNNEIDEKIDCIEFNRLISKLNKKEQEIISLKILSDFSFQEISELLNEPVGTVKWRYYKSLHSIKAMLGSFAMFVITFTIGMKAIFTNLKTGKQEETVQSEENVNDVRQEIENTSSQDSDSMNGGELQEEEQHKEMQDIIQEENTTREEDTNKAEENRTEQNSTTENTIEETEIKDETISNTITQENQIKQETMVSKEFTENEISYMGIGFIGISVIFFIMTIIFFIKYQLKTKKKLSK